MGDDQWIEVGDRVYVRRHRSMDLNVGLVVGEGACLVVDTRATEEQGRELADAVRQVTPHPWVVVNTHFHFDQPIGCHRRYETAASPPPATAPRRGDTRRVRRRRLPGHRLPAAGRRGTPV